MNRNTLRSIIRFLFRWLSHLQVEGQQNIPLSGACILVANHISRLDPALIFALVDRQDITALVAEKYQKVPPIRYLVNAIDGIWINRGEADLQALRAAIAHLEGGGMLGVAPEGTRSHTRALIPGKTGVAYLVEKTGVPVIPVGITGTEDAIKKLLRLRRPTIIARIGEPFSLPPVDRHDRSTGLQRNTDQIMTHITALLPPAYRGVYADKMGKEDPGKERLDRRLVL